MSLLTLRGLFERLRAPSQSQKGHFYEKTKLKKWHHNSWNWQKSAQSSEIFVTSRGICRGVGSELEKRRPFSILDKNGAHKKKAWDSTCEYCGWLELLHLGSCGWRTASPPPLSNTWLLTRREGQLSSTSPAAAAATPSNRLVFLGSCCQVSIWVRQNFSIQRADVTFF